MSSKRLSNIIYYYKPNHPIKIVPPNVGFIEYWRKWQFLRNRYNKLGLYHDDVIYEYPDVKEAVRRLPRAIKEERDWRFLRAIQLDLKLDYLPPEEWTQYEDDITKGRYLQPYIEEVRKEMEEREKWNSIY